MEYKWRGDLLFYLTPTSSQLPCSSSSSELPRPSPPPPPPFPTLQVSYYSSIYSLIFSLSYGSTGELFYSFSSYLLIHLTLFLHHCSPIYTSIFSFIRDFTGQLFYSSSSIYSFCFFCISPSPFLHFLHLHVLLLLIFLLQLQVACFPPVPLLLLHLLL